MLISGKSAATFTKTKTFTTQADQDRTESGLCNWVIEPGYVFRIQIQIQERKMAQKNEK
jgi:hypothetical protein